MESDISGAFCPPSLQPLPRFPFAIWPPFPLTGWVLAGFPSPADDYTEKRLSLDDLVNANSPAVFFFRVEGESMRDAGIHSGDVLVVDRAAPVVDGAVIVARLEDDLYVKRFKRHKGQMWLFAEHEAYPPLCIAPERDFEMYGTVTHIVYKPR